MGSKGELEIALNSRKDSVDMHSPLKSYVIIANYLSFSSVYSLK
jgi:hypothetical protein